MRVCALVSCCGSSTVSACNEAEDGCLGGRGFVSRKEKKKNEGRNGKKVRKGEGKHQKRLRKQKEVIYDYE